MPTSITDTLTRLRSKKNYSLEVLGNLVGVSRQTIHKYEKGLKTPSPTTLQKLAEALQVHPSVFFEEDNIDLQLESIEFRQEHNILDFDKETAEIKNEIIEHLRKFLELESLLSKSEKFINPLEGSIIRNEIDVEKAAKTLRRKWKLGSTPISNLTNLLESKGIIIVEISRSSSFTGLSGYVNDQIPVITVNKNFTDITRKRFTLAHELAHLLLEFEDTIQKRVERLCDYFAGAILIVDEALGHELGKNRTSISINELIRIKEKYGISVQAIMIRAKATEFISYQTSRHWWNNYQIWLETEENLNTPDHSNQIFKENPSRFDEMLLQVLSENRITLSRASELSGLKIDQLKPKLDKLFNL